jgi:hypothetical protein
MASKKGTSKGKAEVTASSDSEWKKSKYSESTLLQLVDEGLLQAHEVVQWRESGSHTVPYKNVNELVLFQQFIERGLTLPVSEFLRNLLSFYGIQIHHLVPNLILLLSVFVHLCEALLGIPPHFNLFAYLFHVKPHPTNANPSRIGGCGFQLIQGRGSEYIE